MSKVRRPSVLHLDSKSLARAMETIRGDTRFQGLMDQFWEAREAAITDLCNDAVVSDPNKVFAAIGEIRAYNAILALNGGALNQPPKPPEDTAETPEPEAEG